MHIFNDALLANSMLQKFIVLLTSLFICVNLFSQKHYGFELRTKKESCEAGTAELKIHPDPSEDSVKITWSQGASNLYRLNNLNEGNYHVQISIRYVKDTIVVTQDTTLYFSIGNEPCPVFVDKYFSPNGDNYHDNMGVSNVQKYPNFELNIYNKWGQRVHHQTHSYEPWDGTWNGIALPDGTYYWVFFYDASDKGNLSKGDVTILR